MKTLHTDVKSHDYGVGGHCRSRKRETEGERAQDILAIGQLLSPNQSPIWSGIKGLFGIQGGWLPHPNTQPSPSRSCTLNYSEKKNKNNQTKQSKNRLCNKINLLRTLKRLEPAVIFVLHCGSNFFMFCLCTATNKQ